MKINVLGEEYTLERACISDDKALETLSGYCDSSVRKIVVRGYSDRENTHFDVKDIENVIQKTIRHEIVHAFLVESGLDIESEWATNEETVDWIALQLPKIYRACQEAGAV